MPRLRWLVLLVILASMLAGLTVAVVYRATLATGLQPQEPPNMAPLSWPPTT